MIEVAELIEATGDPPNLRPLLRQIGIRKVVTLLEAGEQRMRWLRTAAARDQAPSPVIPPRGERCWDRGPLGRLQQQYRDEGFQLTVIEDFPPLDAARLGTQRRDEQIEWFCDQVRAMGELGIEVLCFNWMAISSWARTDIAATTRGGALTTAVSSREAEASPPLAEPGQVTETKLWANYEYFLKAVVPVAESAGVRLALHPDDPPLPVVRGVPRIMSSVEAFRRALDLVPSPSNGLTLCQGNFALMTDDLPGLIREFGRREAIHFVHFRDVRGSADDFIETFHDDGPTDMLACLEAYRDAGVDGVLRPDHVPALYGEDNGKPGYSVLGRLFAVGYIRGLLAHVEAGAAA